MKRYRILMFISVLFLFSILQASAQMRNGDVITFGHYEQDNDPFNGPEPIEWQILTKEGGLTLLISRYGLDGLPYHSSFEEITGEKCWLRQWLNGEFIETAFTDAERDLIDHVTNKTLPNPEAGTDGGADTEDSIFLLSIEEVARYFPSVKDRTCAATDLAKEKGILVDWVNDDNSFWWLRSTGYSPYSAAIVYSNGLLYMYGSRINSTRAVRPALWIRTD